MLNSTDIHNEPTPVSIGVSPSSTATAVNPEPAIDLSHPPSAMRHRLSSERLAVTHHFSIVGHEGYMTVGLYPSGQPGELFLRMVKEGSTIAGLDGMFRNCSLGRTPTRCAPKSAL